MQAPKSKKRGWVWLLLIVAIMGGGAYYWRNSLPFVPAKEDKSIQTADVTEGDIEDTVTAQGKLEPKNYVDVGAQISGQLEHLHVEIGDVVKKGDLIAEIDPEIYESKVAADEAALKTLAAQRAETSATVTQTQQKLERNTTMYNAQAIAKEVFEDAQTALKVAQAQLARVDAQIEQAESTLEGDRTSLSYAKIYAPMDGTVVSQTTREGQTINANQTAPVIVQLANLDVMTVRAQVAEADISKIVPDQDVYFTTLGSSGRRWEAKVRQVLPTPETINNVVLYNVLVDVDNKDRQLMTGMSTQMFFVQGRATKVPLVPVAALGKKTGDAYEVSVLNGKTTETRKVTLGLQNRTVAQVKQGLAVGDKVVLPLAMPAGAPKGGAAASGGGRMMGGGPRL